MTSPNRGRRYKHAQEHIAESCARDLARATKELNFLIKRLRGAHSTIRIYGSYFPRSKSVGPTLARIDMLLEQIGAEAESARMANFYKRLEEAE